MRKCLWGTTKKKLEELFNQMDAVQDDTCLLYTSHADDFMAFFQKPFAEVGADEAGSSGDQNPFTHDSMSMRFALRRRCV